MKMTEPCNLGLLALISAAGEISYEELKQRYLPPEQPGVIQGVTASFDNDIKTLEKEKYISVHGNINSLYQKVIDRKTAGHSSHKATVSGYFRFDNDTLL